MMGTSHLASSSHVRLARWIGYVIAAAILALAAFALVRSFRNLDAGDLEIAFHAIPMAAIWTCAVLTGFSFIALGLYDVLAVRLVAPDRIPFWGAWFVGATANAISNTVGLHGVTAAAIRYKIYSRSGLKLPDIVRVTSLSWTALAFGFASMFGLTIMSSPIAPVWQRAGGAILLALLLLGTKWLGPGKHIFLKGALIPLPPGKFALAQMVLGALEMAAAIGGLYVLMPAGTAPSFPTFSVIYIGAVLLGIVSHAPGGLGVFEATILTLSHGEKRAGIVAALLLYRLIYNLLPFVIAVAAFGVEELRAAFNSSADTGG